MRRRLRDRIIRHVLVTVTAAWLALGAIPAVAQSLWDMTPYRLQLIVATADDGRLPADYAPRLSSQVVDRLDSLVGAAWQIESIAPDAHLRQLLLDDLAQVTAEDLPPSALETDKVLLVSVGASSRGTKIRSREYDVRTQTWGATVERQDAQTRPLTNEVVRAVFDSFTPLALVDKVENKVATLKLRAAGLPPRDPGLSFVSAGDIFRPIMRLNERDGSVKKLQGVPYTYVMIDEVGDTDAKGAVHSGIRGALAARKRGRTEQLALKIKSPSGVTRLELCSRTEPDRPLVGYEVFAYGPNDKTTVSLGRSDSQGVVEVPPGPQPIRILVVKSGGEFLARLPIVPGLEARVQAPMQRDDERVSAEGFIVGLQEELVDLVVRREVLMALIRARLDEGKLAEAEKLNNELGALRTREQFALLIDAQKQRTVSKDPLLQRKIDRLFTDTLQLVNNFMASAPLDELQHELREARQAAAPAAPAAAPAAAPSTPAPAPATPAPAASPAAPAAAPATAPAGGDAPADKPAGGKSLRDVFQEMQEEDQQPAENGPAGTPPAGS
ncbi:MAG: hypothetical protein KF708_08625 [Pirellulales bacterium]|nr:hypothetical protein [Pirellulales bacterium]